MVDVATAAPPVVAVVGRPNVGKSSLVNRVLGRREAIVEERPGVTRDRRSWRAEWAGRAFEIVDTGGLEPGARGLDALVAEQAAVAIEAADAVMLVVDASTGPLEDDLLVADRLRRAGKPVVVAANKADDPRDEPGAAAFYRLGLGEPVAVSALHGRGSGDLLDALVQVLPAARGEAEGTWASAAIVGRPNVGKSSILNELVGEPRALVDARPGTTRDPVDSLLTTPGGRSVRIVDTAGMRRRVQVTDPIEYFSLLRSSDTLGRVDVALLVVDASEGVTAHDQRIAEAVVTAGRACVVALNKWDLLDLDDAERTRAERAFKHQLRFLPWATVRRTSALTRRGLDRLPAALEAAVESHRRRLDTATVNRLVQAAQQERPHPRTGGRAVRVLYAVQARTSPPTILLFANRSLDVSYLRYLDKRVRALEPFAGTPLRFEVRLRARPELEG